MKTTPAYLIGLCSLGCMGLGIANAKESNSMKLQSYKALEWQAMSVVPVSARQSWQGADSVRYMDYMLDQQATAELLSPSAWDPSKHDELLTQILHRDLGELWLQYHYVRNFGYSDLQIKETYLKRTLGPVQAFDSLLLNQSESWARALYLDSSKVNQYYQAHKFDWKKPRQYLLSVILAPLSQSSKIQMSLTKNSFEKIAQEYSIDSASAHHGGFLGWYYQGVEPGVLGPFGKWLYDTLFVQKNNQNQIYFKQTKDSLAYWIKVNQFKDEEIPPFDSVKSYTEDQIVQNYRQNLNDSLFESLSKSFGGQIMTLPYPKAMDFYIQNSNQFMSPLARRLFVNQSQDSLALTQIRPQNLQTFRNAKVKKITNKYVPKGDLGWVNESWGLPYDLGNPQGLEVQLRELKAGQVSSVYKVPGQSNYMILWVDSVRAPQLKPFDRVKAAVNKAIQTTPIVFADTTPLLRLGDSVVLREQDYQEVYKSLAPRQKAQMTRGDLLKQMLWSKLLLADAQANRFEQAPLAQIRQNLSAQALKSEIYRSSEQKYLGQPKAKVDSMLRAKANYFPAADKGGIETAALYLEMPSVILEAEWAQTLESSGSALGESKDSLFVKIFAREYQKAKDRRIMLQKIKRWGQDSVARKRLGLYSDAMEFATEIPKMSQWEPKNRAVLLSKALNALVGQKSWENLAYESAKAWTDILKHEEALKVLNLIIYASPNSILADKALFMKGYIQMDQLRDEAAALITFKRLVRDYPKSALADDADFLIRDLQSGRKLSQELLHKLESK